ncbi:MAG: hypothetical protein ACRC7O_06160 [Fimbriiglobus sp.]
MTAYEFGRRLLDANDLDPVYALLYCAELPEDHLRRWLIAYWCFYHVGTASWAADGKEAGFWDRVETAAKSKEYPRSSERRHFRGKNAADSVRYLEGRGVPALFDDLLSAGPTAAAKTAAVREWVGFGPWVAFKVADMLERLGICDVRFDAGTAMYDGSPTKAAYRLWEIEKSYPPTDRERKVAPEWAARRVIDELKEYKAPPRFDRPISFQEAETVLCKWKSSLGGHYEVGEDVAACRKSLDRFGRTPTARVLLTAGKAGGLWQ